MSVVAADSKYPVDGFARLQVLSCSSFLYSFPVLSSVISCSSASASCEIGKVVRIKHEVDPPSFVFGGSNFLVRNLPFSPLGYLVLLNAR